MALRRNIAGVLINDVSTLKCADDSCYQVDTGQIVEQYRPSSDSGVFPPITAYPYDPITANQPPGTVVDTVPNVLPVTTGEAPEKKINTGALILAGLGVVLYMGMTKSKNNAESLLYIGGIGLLYYRMHLQDKNVTPAPVTE